MIKILGFGDPLAGVCGGEIAVAEAELLVFKQTAWAEMTATLR